MNLLLLLLPILVPILGSIAIGSSKVVKEQMMDRVIVILTVLNLFLVLLANHVLYGEIFHLLRAGSLIDFNFRIDQFGRLFSTMASILWVLTAFYSIEYMKHEGRQRRFFTFFILTLAMVIGLSYAGNLLTLYLFYELITLTTFPLVIHPNTDAALRVGRSYITYSFTGAAFVMLGMILINSVSPNLIFVPGGMTGLLEHPSRNLILFSYLSMFFGFGVKAAMIPLHGWLPAAMVAPTPVSALLHAVAVVKSGIFALVRITYYIYGSQLVMVMGATKILIPFAIGTILIASFIAMNQYNLKRRLAYSTVAQLGYIVLGILMLNPVALLGALLHMINHAIIKINLFFAVGAVSYMTEKKLVKQMNGLGKKMPMTFLCFTVAAISLIGIPPANGFVSKWFLGVGALKSGNVVFAVVILFGALLTASYLLPLIVAAFFNKSHDKTKVQGENLDPPKMMLVPMFILLGITVILGLYPNPVIAFLQVIVDEVF